MALAAAVGTAVPAGGHVVYGSASLAELVGGAEVVARARIEREAEPLAAQEPGSRRPVVTAVALEVFKGELEPGPLRFAQHGHGVAPFERGQEVLLFLVSVGQSGELAGLAQTTDLRWVSRQEHDAAFVVDESSRAALSEAVRAYVALAGIEHEPERLARFREMTVRLLRSPQPRLAESAVRDLVTLGDTVVTAENLPQLLPLIDDPEVGIGVRLGVLTVVARLGRIDAEPHWLRLLRSVGPPELRSVVRAAGAHPSPGVRRELIRLLREGNGGIAEAAALALGVPGSLEAVDPLAAALGAGDPRLAMAAIRALGRVASPEAVAALREAARKHPDAAIRRRAEAELRRLGG